MSRKFVNLLKEVLYNNTGTLLTGIGGSAFIAGLRAPTAATNAAPNMAPTAAPTTAPTMAPTPQVLAGAQAPDPAPADLEEKKIQAQQALEEAKKLYETAAEAFHTATENAGEGDVLTDEADALFEANSNLVKAFQNLMIIAQEEYNSAHEMRDLALEYLSVLNYVGEETEEEETKAEALENNLHAAMENLERLRINLAEITVEEEPTHPREALSSPVLCGAFSDLPRVVVTTRTDNETTVEEIVSCAPVDFSGVVSEGSAAS